MSEDLVSTIEELIRSERCDVGRLQNVLDAIKNGEPVSFEDHQYIESLTQSRPKSTPEDTPAEPKPENVFDNIVPDSSPEAPTQETVEPAKRSPAKKYASIGIIVAIIIVAYVGLDVYAVNNLQFRPHHGQQIAISDTELSIQTDACNPSYFPATFTKYEIDAFYNSDIIEKATVGGSTLSPKSAAILDGVFAINKEAVTRIGQQNSTFDPSKATITTSVNAPIFGFIPYAVAKKYPAEEFQQMIKNPPPGTFDCYP
ncbi:protein of unknown function [Nitrosotalea devaniterrae]|uniref:Uncharacterized protein n=1 Tax=Nitrosotalea devaniterrae TaxID=1078905 RepID=A0A128A4R6_9ARCH|nr:protein of unknown function [Candidatus Nitrosotalea devanaterra]